MAQTAPKNSLPEDQAQHLPDLTAEVRALRDHAAERNGLDLDEDQSPQGFYERSIRRADVRDILQRLADS